MRIIFHAINQGNEFEMNIVDLTWDFNGERFPPSFEKKEIHLQSGLTKYTGVVYKFTPCAKRSARFLYRDNFGMCRGARIIFAQIIPLADDLAVLDDDRPYGNFTKCRRFFCKRERLLHKFDVILHNLTSCNKRKMR